MVQGEALDRDVHPGTFIYTSLFTIIMVAQKEKKLQPKAKNASNTQQT